MPELTLSATDLAEATFVVGTLLLLLCGTLLLFFRMAVYTLGSLLVAVTVFLEELADGYLFLHVQVQVLALLTLPTHLLQPVNTYFLFQLVLLRLRVERLNI